MLVLPGRNPAVVAKQLASLDRLSGGRLLVAFGLGLPDASERAAFPIPAGQTRKVTVKLSKAARKLLAKKRKVRAIATVTSHSNAGASKAGATITLKVKAKKR